jgi:hypothetical protein
VDYEKRRSLPPIKELKVTRHPNDKAKKSFVIKIKRKGFKPLKGKKIKFKNTAKSLDTVRRYRDLALIDD